MNVGSTEIQTRQEQLQFHVKTLRLCAKASTRSSSIYLCRCTGRLGLVGCCTNTHLYISTRGSTESRFALPCCRSHATHISIPLPPATAALHWREGTMPCEVITNISFELLDTVPQLPIDPISLSLSLSTFTSPPPPAPPRNQNSAIYIYSEWLSSHNQAQVDLYGLSVHDHVQYFGIHISFISIAVADSSQYYTNYTYGHSTDLCQFQAINNTDSDIPTA